jgi:protein-disulfide isomerase
LRELFRNKFFISAFIIISFILSATVWRHREEDKLAEIDGAVITERQIEGSLGRQLTHLHQQIYKLKRQKLDEIIDAQLVTEQAKRESVSLATLLEREVNGKVSPVTEEEIKSFYDSNKDRLRVEYDKAHDQIRDYLREQKIETQKNAYIKALRSKAKITTYLKPPSVYRAEVADTGAPIRGAEKAPVTIVKFEDFQCPFCKTVQPTVKDLLKKYVGKVRVVHKDLPLDAIHPQARPAAEAARCAGEQGKFWEYHDKLYADSSKLGVEELKSAAKDVGLNVLSFEQCFASGKYRGAVQKDLNDGAQLGITGTPTFFINGRELSGAQPVEAFAAIIDEELGQRK